MKIGLLAVVVMLLSCSCAIVESYRTPVPDKQTASNEGIDEYEVFKIYSQNYPITREITSAEYLKTFKEKICSNLSKRECDTEYDKMIHERMHSEYRVSTVENSTNWCKAYPVECKDIKMIEIHYILSWNQYVDNMKNRGWKPSVWPSKLVMENR